MAGEALVDLADVRAARERIGTDLRMTPVWRPRLFGMREAVVSAGARAEYVDFNVGAFSSTNRPIRDDVVAVVPGLTFRPVPGTVFKLNYRRQWTRDLLGNPAARLGGYQVGVATYF